MINVLSDVVHAGTFLNKISGSGKPMNADTTIEPTSDAGIAIILLSIVVAVLIAIIAFLCYRNSKKTMIIQEMQQKLNDYKHEVSRLNRSSDKTNSIMDNIKEQK